MFRLEDRTGSRLLTESPIRSHSSKLKQEKLPCPSSKDVPCKSTLRKALSSSFNVNSLSRAPATFAFASRLCGICHSDSITKEALFPGIVYPRVPDKPFEVPALELIGQRLSIVGWPSGTGMDSEDTLNFSALTGVESMTETYTLERAAEGYERMMSGKARFRVVITMGK